MLKKMGPRGVALMLVVIAALVVVVDLVSQRDPHWPVAGGLGGLAAVLALWPRPGGT